MKMCLFVDLPKVYKEGYRKVLDADATVVDLHKLGPYFYTFGSLLLQFKHPESTDIAKSLREVSYCFTIEGDEETKEQ